MSKIEMPSAASLSAKRIEWFSYTFFDHGETLAACIAAVIIHVDNDQT
jgi:hypothetical protein